MRCCRNARGDQHRSERRRPRATGGGGSGWQQPAKACVAGADYSGDGGGVWHGRDHAPGRRFEAVCVALAGALRARGGGRPTARQDAKARAAAVARSGGRSCDRTHPGGAAGGNDALDRSSHGRGQRHLAALGAAHLGRPRPAAAPGAALQAVARSGICRQAARRRRALPRPAGAQPRVVGRREVANPSPRSHPAGSADEEGAEPER